MDTRPASILVIDDERSVCISCRRILEDEGHSVEYALGGREGLEKALAGKHDIVLLDLKMPDMSGMDVLAELRKERPDLTVIIITGYATIQTSIEAIKKGAFDYIPKPFTPEELSISVTKALKDRRLRSENEYLKQELSRLGKTVDLVGRSKPMEDITRQILKIAPTDFTVMIYGESGTGKELIAKAIHEHGSRKDMPFVAVDISSLSASLIESELFGHVRGAFTGATAQRPGYFTIAHGGTLFLDEIANISWEMQGKLLRALECRCIRPVGGDHEHKVDVRVVAATNRDLFEMVEKEEFREDLYYRLNVIPITVPPLRERKEDIPLLAVHFLEIARERAGTRQRGFTTEAMAKLVSHAWGGNVRELKNMIERLVATVEHELIEVDDLPSEVFDEGDLSTALTFDDAPKTADELKAVKKKLKEQVYAAAEKSFVLDALNRSGWNVTHAASLVGMQRTNFHALMRKYGVKTRE